MRRRYYPSYLAQQQLLSEAATAVVGGALDSTVAPLEQRLAAIVGQPTPDAVGVPGDLAGLRSLLRIMLGQDQVPSGPWGMSMNRSATRLNMLEPQVAQMLPQVQSALLSIETLREVMQQGFADTATTFALLDAQRQQQLAALQVEQRRNDLQEAKDQLHDAAILELQAKDKLTAALNELQSAQLEQNRLDTLALAARQTATEKKQAADELDIAALKASDANQAAQLVAQASGIEADRQLAVAAQATAEQAKADAKAAKELAQTAKDRADLAEADAQAAKTLAQNAQAAANTAQAGMSAANTRIDTVVGTVNTVQAAVKTAQDTATTAQNAVAALGDKGRVLLGIATPASLGLLSNGGTISVPLSWAKAFPDTLYTAGFIRTSGGTAAMGVSLTNRTPTSCTLVLTYNGTLSLAVPAGTGDVVLTHS